MSDLWTLAAAKLRETERKQLVFMIMINLVIATEKTVVFVGEKQSGKSSLIAKFLEEPVKDDMKETTALDYRYGTRYKEDKKQKVNIYELGNYIITMIGL